MTKEQKIVELIFKKYINTTQHAKIYIQAQKDQLLKEITKIINEE